MSGNRHVDRLGPGHGDRATVTGTPGRHGGPAARAGAAPVAVAVPSGRGVGLPLALTESTGSDSVRVGGHNLRVSDSEVTTHDASATVALRLGAARDFRRS